MTRRTPEHPRRDWDGQQATPRGRRDAKHDLPGVLRSADSEPLLDLPPASPTSSGLTRALAAHAWAWVAAVLWCGVAWIAFRQYRHALTISYVGVDARPLQRAGQAVLDGTDVYEVHNFVYPPSAAVMSVPLTWVDSTMLARASVAAGEVVIAGLALAAVVAFVAPRPWRPTLAPVLAAGLLGGFVSFHALALGNVSVLLAPVIVGVAVLGGGGRWWWASALLGASLLLKPLLAPVLLVAFLARRWLPPVVCLGAVVVAALASLTFTGGARRIAHVVLTLLRGSILIGDRAVNNLSLTGFAAVHHVPSVELGLARLLVVLLASVCVAVAALVGRTPNRAQVAWTASALLLSVYLAGNLSEVHYLYALVPGAVAVVARARSWIARALALAGLATLSLPLDGLPPRVEQAWSLEAEVVLLLASTAAALASLPAVTRANDSLPDGHAPK